MRRARSSSRRIARRLRHRPVLAVASGGGHWVELMRLRPAWEGMSVVYASVNPDYAAHVAPHDYFVLPDGNLHTKIALVRVFFSALALVLRVRPAAVVSTGAAPGYFAMVFARLYGSRTIWVDSIANADELSLSGSNIRLFADVWLTQWEHLAGANGPCYHGRVL